MQVGILHGTHGAVTSAAYDFRPGARRFSPRVIPTTTGPVIELGGLGAALNEAAGDVTISPTHVLRVDLGYNDYPPMTADDVDGAIADLEQWGGDKIQVLSMELGGAIQPDGRTYYSVTAPVRLSGISPTSAHKLMKQAVEENASRWAAGRRAIRSSAKVVAAVAEETGKVAGTVLGGVAAGLSAGGAEIIKKGWPVLLAVGVIGALYLFGQAKVAKSILR